MEDTRYTGGYTREQLWKKLEDSVRNFLPRLGLTEPPLELDRFVCAVVLVHTDNYYLQKVKARLFPAVAKRFEGYTPKDVEQELIAIRDYQWTYGNRAFLNKLAGIELVLKPTTGELIKYIREYMDYWGLMNLI